MSIKKNILLDFKKNKSKKEIAEKYDITIRYVNKIIQEEKINKELFKNQQTIQKLRDMQRIAKKINRENYRKNNSTDQYLSEISNKIKKIKIPELKKYKSENCDEKYEGIFQFSDAHFNEIIEMAENTYDFDVASQRLKKYVIDASKIFKLYNVKKILISLTGDILGSDRRVDEKLNQATNRSKAIVVGVFLLEQAIRELNADFDIKIAAVCGNESRVYEVGDSEKIMSDNYDFVLIQMLKMIFRKNLDIFIDGDPYKKIIKIKNKNIMMLHGHNIGKNPENDITKLKSQNANIFVDYIIFGHIHQCHIADCYARSSSLSGGNAYSINQLKFESKASQNIHLISEKSINSFKIDLHDVEGIEGYPVNAEFDLHKNAKNLNNPVYIF